jgi:hypothetical protein
MTLGKKKKCKIMNKFWREKMIEKIETKSL